MDPTSKASFTLVSFPWRCKWKNMTIRVLVDKKNSFRTRTLVKENLPRLIGSTFIVFKVLRKKLKTSHIYSKWQYAMSTMSIIRTRDHFKPPMTSLHHLWLHRFVGYSVASASLALGFNPVKAMNLSGFSTELRSTLRIIASLDFISGVQCI